MVIIVVWTVFVSESKTGRPRNDTADLDRTKKIQMFDKLINLNADSNLIKLEVC